MIRVEVGCEEGKGRKKSGGLREEGEVERVREEEWGVSSAN